jgi:hypothetical protein
LYTRASVRVLLVEAEGRAMPFVRDLLVEFDEVGVTTADDRFRSKDCRCR